MPNMAKIHQGKEPIRRHFIKEWMERRNMSAPELGRELGVDKSQVYRWLKGQLPNAETQVVLSQALHLDGPEDLLRHPDDDWISKFLRGRPDEEIEKIRQVLELTFPPRTGTEN